MSKGWVTISASFSRGWTASGEHMAGTGVGETVRVVVGSRAAVGARVERGTGLAEGSPGVGAVCAAGAQELTSSRIHPIKHALQTFVMRRGRAGLDFKFNFARVRIGFFRVEQTRFQAEFPALLFTAHVQREDVFALHGFNDTGRGDFLVLVV